MVSQKIQATASKKGFTLVELIVVITILAILGTIGFISIQGYSAQSRDSKRVSDLRSLASALTIKATDGIALTSFVTTTTSATIAVTAGSGASLAGTALTGGLTDYAAGTPNFTALGVSAANFKDGNYDYRIGTSTRDGGVFQIAATLEAGSVKTATTSGNYAPRQAIQFSGSGILNSGSGFTVSNLSGSGVGYFNKGDRVFVGGVQADISSVNGDGKGFVANSITTNPTFGTVTVALGQIAAGWSEVPGLMASTLGVTTSVTNGSTTNLPYSY